MFPYANIFNYEMLYGRTSLELCKGCNASYDVFLSQPSPKSNPNSNLGLAGQHNWS